MKDEGSDIGARKALLRVRLRRELAGGSTEARAAQDAQRLRQILAAPPMARATALLSYVSCFDHEADTMGLLRWALAEGRPLFAPLAGPEGRMTWGQVESLAALRRSRLGILEPPAPAAPLPEWNAGAVCIVPGLAFTRTGDRLGHGGGYYDRFLAGFSGTAIGLAREAQIQPELPHESHDMRMDFVVTEAAVYET